MVFFYHIKGMCVNSCYSLKLNQLDSIFMDKKHYLSNFINGMVLKSQLSHLLSIKYNTVNTRIIILFSHIKASRHTKILKKSECIYNVKLILPKINKSVGHEMYFLRKSTGRFLECLKCIVLTYLVSSFLIYNSKCTRYGKSEFNINSK